MKKLLVNLIAFLVFGFVSSTSTLAQDLAVLPSAIFISPIGGEQYIVGSKLAIKLSTNNVDIVTFGYKSCDSCLNEIPGFTDLKIGIATTDLSLGWKIPEDFKPGTYRLEVIAYHREVGSVVVVSNAFTIITMPPTTPSKK